MNVDEKNGWKCMKNSKTVDDKMDGSGWQQWKIVNENIDESKITNYMTVDAQVDVLI